MNNDRDQIILDPNDPQLIDKIKKFNNTPNRYGLAASLIPLQEFTDVLPQQDPYVKDFLAIFQSLQTECIITNVWGIAAVIEFSYGENIKSYDQRHLVQHFLVETIKYIQTSKIQHYMHAITAFTDQIDIDQIRQIINETHTSLQNSILDFTKNLSLNPSMFKDNNSAIYSLVPIQSSSMQHYVAIALWGNLCCVGNREFGDIGIKIYTVDSETRKWLLKEGTLRQSINKIHISNLHKHLRQQNLIYNRTMKRSMSGQSCWTAIKSLYWIAFYINTMQTISKSDLDLKAQSTIAATLAHAAYKYFGLQARILALDYFSKSKHILEDQTSLALLCAKIKQHNMKARAVDNLLTPYFGAVKSNINPYVLKLIYEIFEQNMTTVQQYADMVSPNDLLCYNFDCKRDRMYCHPLLAAVLQFTIKGLSCNFSTQFKILEIIVQRGLTNLQWNDGYFGPLDMIETTCASNGMMIYPDHRKQLSELLKPLDMPKTKHLNYSIECGDFRRVERILSNANFECNERENSKTPFDRCLEYLIYTLVKDSFASVHYFAILEQLIAAKIILSDTKFPIQRFRKLVKKELKKSNTQINNLLIYPSYNERIVDMLKPLGEPQPYYKKLLCRYNNG